MRTDPAIALFSTFGVTTRLIVFQRLARHPQTASELAREMPVSRSGIVQHLAALRAQGLVEPTRDGRRQVYRAVPQALAPLAAWLARHQRTPAQSYRLHRPRYGDPGNRS
jgi:DNA-binding transcriptional ArsR family regulator